MLLCASVVQPVGSNPNGVAKPHIGVAATFQTFLLQWPEEPVGVLGIAPACSQLLDPRRGRSRCCSHWLHFGPGVCLEVMARVGGCPAAGEAATAPGEKPRKQLVKSWTGTCNPGHGTSADPDLMQCRRCCRAKWLVTEWTGSDVRLEGLTGHSEVSCQPCIHSFIGDVA